MFIQTEAADDPRIMTFLPGRAVLSAGTAEFPDADAARRSPLARRLFDVAGVETVTFKTDAIVVERSDDADWQALKPPVLGAIMDHFTAGQPVLLDEPTAAPAGAGDADAETVRKIEDLIATRIQPAVRDGDGKVAYHSFTDGVLYLKLEGSAFGLVAGIQNMIRHYLPQVQSVRDYRAGLPKPGLKSAMGVAVQELLDKSINPSVAAHGGHIALIDVDTSDKTVFLKLEGGCQGCGQADVTLKQGIETEIKKFVPEVLHVLDTTDHAEGKNPYFQMR